MALTNDALFVSVAGGQFRAVTSDGEEVFSLAVPPGKVPVREFLALVPEGCSPEFEGVAVVCPRLRVALQPYGEGVMQSGANPDYQPTSASRFEMQMKVQMAALHEQSNRIEARQRALDAVERIPQAPAPAPEPPLVE